MRVRTLITALVLILLPCGAYGVLPEQPRREASPPDSVLVKYRPGVTPQQIHLHAASLGIEMIREPGARSGPLGKLRVSPAEHARLLRDLNASGLVEFAEPNHRRFPHITEPDDPRFEDQWVMATLAMTEAWDIQTGDGTVTIAVIDDGVDSGHEDLMDNVIAGKCFGPNDFCGGDPDNGDPRTADDAHGTLVAGQAGAVGNNNLGITGTAWNVKILPIRTDLTVEYIVQAIHHAIDQNVQIINASFGGATESLEEKEAIDAAREAGVLFVTSAGNSHTDNDKGLLSFPQAYDVDNIVAVAASDETDRLTSWAQYGQTTVDVAAGGLGILSTNAAVAGGGDYLTVSGSSFASPLVAGIAALLRMNDPGTERRYEDLKARLVAGADMPDALKGRVAGGRANAFNALQWDLANDPVFVIDGIAVDDAVDGTGNSVLDAGETANLVVTVRSLGGPTADVSGTLVAETPGSDDVIEVTEDMAGPVPISAGNTAELAYQVRVPDAFVGNERVMFRLDLTWPGGGVTRWFEHELGVVVPNTVHDFTIGRTRHEHYHAFHVDVPAGATEFRIDTATDDDYDIDLLVRPDAPPRYQINLGQGPDSSNPLFVYQPVAEVEVSGEFDGNEMVTYAAPNPGVYHLVIVNFGLTRQAYRLSTSWCTAEGCHCTAGSCAGRLRFSQGTFNGGASQSSVTVNVVRQGGTSGAVAVRYSTDAEESSAVAGTDYTPVSGTLAWTDGDDTARSFTIPLLEGRTAGRMVGVRLENPAGTTLMTPDAAAANIEVAPLPPPRSGGGGALPAALVVALAGFAFVRRRVRPAA